MKTIKYYMPNDIYAYEITCPNTDIWQDYVELLINNNAYKIFINDTLIYDKSVDKYQ